VQKASKETWSTFCTSINELPKAARLHRALTTLRLGLVPWWLPQESAPQSEEDTLDLLLQMHSQVLEQWGRRLHVISDILRDWIGRWQRR
jgi:hypothetical protein